MHPTNLGGSLPRLSGVSRCFSLCWFCSGLLQATAELAAIEQKVEEARKVAQRREEEKNQVSKVWVQTINA